MPDANIRLLHQRQTTTVAEDGEVHDVVELTFTVDGWGPFVQSVDADAYDPATIDAILANWAERVRQTAAQYSGGGPGRPGGGLRSLPSGSPTPSASG